MSTVHSIESTSGSTWLRFRTTSVQVDGSPAIVYIREPKITAIEEFTSECWKVHTGCGVFFVMDDPLPMIAGDQ